MHGTIIRSGVTGGGKEELEKWSECSARTTFCWKEIKVKER